MTRFALPFPYRHHHPRAKTVLAFLTVALLACAALLPGGPARAGTQKMASTPKPAASEDYARLDAQLGNGWYRGTDFVVATVGDAKGMHYYVGREDEGFAWRPSPTGAPTPRYAPSAPRSPPAAPRASAPAAPPAPATPATPHTTWRQRAPARTPPHDPTIRQPRSTHPDRAETTQLNKTREWTPCNDADAGCGTGYKCHFRRTCPFVVWRLGFERGSPLNRCRLGADQ